MAPASEQTTDASEATLLTLEELATANNAAAPTRLERLGHLIRTLFEPLMTTLRFVKLVVIFLPCIVMLPVTFFGPIKPGSDGERVLRVYWYQLVARQMERAGPSFIKLAQWAASRVDIFPHELCRCLSRLHAETKPHAFHHTRRAVEKAFCGKPLELLFEWFEETPIGAGAIAQVYRAKFRPNVLPPLGVDPSTGRPLPPPDVVAIKVIHPGIAPRIERDLRIMSMFAGLIHMLPGMQWLSLPEEVQVFGEMMRSQLDMRCEAKHLDRFKHDFRYRYTVAFPRPVTCVAKRDVLVEEYIYAVPMRKFLEAQGTVYDRIMSRIGIDSFLHMLILDNFVHADLHPGNILVRFARPTTRDLIARMWSAVTQGPPPPRRPDESAVRRLEAVESDLEAWKRELELLFAEGYRPRLVFLDAGLVAELSDQNRQNFIDLFKAIVTFDGYLAGQLMVERCRTPDLAVDANLFAIKMQDVVRRVRDNTFSLEKVSIGDILLEVMNMVRAHHVKLEGDFTNVVLSLLIMEGIGRQLDPGLDLTTVSLATLRDLGRLQAGRRVLVGLRDIGAADGLLLTAWLWLEAKEWVSISWDGREVIHDCDLYMPDV
ncbi:ABC1 family-domain-containing protein [Thamnocephalis sphaerospora]|uniref:ABC1 family-domain-containing protein n=1 Tax=Thamnocephalis sphaerospora TaxID=78915 RepID=A0A4P9XU83_9FUNG|nr:ABC1 family-domain-containing protein [Thamnocephalis sphaerospora]|eukprot:RKP09775.1 ABC1 family-domain-containing protein [Thamnocephalis sphaerospora]